MIEIIFEGEFTTLNDYIEAERSSKFKAAEIKKFETTRIGLESLGVLPIPPEYYPMKVSFFWRRKTAKTDPDNVAFAKKFILDGLQKAGVIVNDSYKEIAMFVDYFIVDPENPHVIVRFERN